MTGEYSEADLRRILRLDGSKLRTCLRAALLPLPRAQSGGTYSFQNLVVLRTAKGLTDAGVSVARIRRVLECLERQLGEETAISSLKIYASGKRVVVWDGASRWQPDSGQFLLNFETAHILPPRPLTPRPARLRNDRDSAQRWLQRALAFEEDSPEEARRAYEEAIRLDPTLTDAHINLGLLYHDLGHLVEAERCYRRALAFQPSLALAHFNLGVVLEDREKKSAALKAYQEALKHAPDFLEAHCNLAQLYEKLGRKRDAFRHYAAANRLSG
ncbi:MAG TPA: tetratricopeptide repeat protein [Nitrospira sp.]|jgi:tetratricopeptide (TPR) repeat protein|nr:tetratricopeptide repeat protein [Nitrospira sp.]